MNTPSRAATALSVENLTITLPNGRRLLEGADLHIKPGEFVMLVGPSGSGKTTLLRHIAGLSDGDETGIRVDGHVTRPSAGEDRQGGSVGLVFQNLALFDELTAEGNVQFAIDHCASDQGVDNQNASTILRDLGVPLDGRLDRLSGGERRRVAVARTLAARPDLLLFDEPTAGLDPFRARDVADLIAGTHEQYEKTTIVVTHDFTPFLKYKPRLILLDDVNGSLRGVEESDLYSYFERPPSEREAEPAIVDVVGPLQERLSRWLRAPGEVAWTALTAPVAACRGWRYAKWKGRYFRHYFRMAAVGTTAIYVALAGAMLGFVFTSFSFSRVPYTEVVMPLLTEEFLAATGYSTFRVVVPLLVGVLIAGKCGAAVAADVGARRLTHQFDALRSLNVRPENYLYGNIALALVIGCPLLTAIAFVTNCVAALVAYLMVSPDTAVSTFYRNFFALIRPDGQFLPLGWGWVLAKAAGEGLLIAAVGYTIGARPKSSAADVSRDVGLSIFWGSLVVLLLHSVFSFVEF